MELVVKFVGGIDVGVEVSLMLEVVLVLVGSTAVEIFETVVFVPYVEFKLYAEELKLYLEPFTEG